MVSRLWCFTQARLAVLALVVVICVCSLVSQSAASQCTVPSQWLRMAARGEAIVALREPANEWNAYVGNGYLATRIGSGALFVGGIFNGLQHHTPSHRALIPSPFDLTIRGAKHCASALDLLHGMFHRLLTLPDNSTVAQTWYAHQVHRNVLVHLFTYRAADEALPQSVIHFERYSNHTVDFEVAFTPASQSGASFDLWSGTSRLPETFKSGTHQVVACTTPVPEALTLNHSNTQYFYAVFSNSLESNDPNAHAKMQFERLLSADPASISPSHVDAWAEIWKGAIVIHGNDRLRDQVRCTFYYVISSIRKDYPYGISPGGLSTNGYNGHTFWDQETWVYPGLLMTHQELAHSLLVYRENRLKAAIENAILHGNRGAQFPWESAFTGLEVVPNPGEFGTGNPEGMLEIHISGDVLFAMTQYYYATGDPVFLKDVLFPMALNVSTFWANRVLYNTTKQQYTILNVQPPDEGAGQVNNSAYTNVLCALSLNITMELGNILKTPTPSKWAEIANNMYVPFDENLQIHQEYDGYNGTRLIHQADVALLQYPLRWSMSRRIAVNDLLYWQNHTDPNGYFTGDSAYSIAWLALGNLDEAAVQWNTSFSHMEPPFWVWKERVTGGHSNFLTGAGGFLQNLVFGYGGLNVASDRLTMIPRLPPLTSGVVLQRIQYMGAQLSLAIGEDSCTLTLQQRGSCALKIFTSSSTDPVELKLLTPQVFARSAIVQPVFWINC